MSSVGGHLYSTRTSLHTHIKVGWTHLIPNYYIFWVFHKFPQLSQKQSLQILIFHMDPGVERRLSFVRPLKKSRRLYTVRSTYSFLFSLSFRFSTLPLRFSVFTRRYSLPILLVLVIRISLKLVPFQGFVPFDFCKWVILTNLHNGTCYDHTRKLRRRKICSWR